ERSILGDRVAPEIGERPAERTDSVMFDRSADPFGERADRTTEARARVLERDVDRQTAEIGVGRGLRVQRRFTAPDEAALRAGRYRIDPIESETWERRSAVISGEGGEVVFEQHGVEVPAAWSQLATNVVASKYFRGQLGTPERETSVKQLVGRVVGSIRHWGEEQG